MENVLAHINSVRKSYLEKYPKYEVLMTELFDDIEKLLHIDYSCISGGKRIKAFGKSMYLIMKKALENNMQKNFMLGLVAFFKNEAILEYLTNSFGNKSGELISMISSLWHTFFAWQGLEGCEWKRLERIEKILL